MSKIFISYRREDSAGPARRIFQFLKPLVPSRNDVAFGGMRVPRRANAAEHVDKALSQYEVLLAVIGPGWLTSIDSRTGLRRLDDPNDLVRLQIATALKRGMRVIPVLMDGVPFPIASALPDELKALAAFDKIEMKRRNFDSDLERLVRGLGVGSSDWYNPLAKKKTKRDTNILYQGLSMGLGIFLLAAGGAGIYVYDPFHLWTKSEEVSGDPGAPEISKDPNEAELVALAEAEATKEQHDCAAAGEEWVRLEKSKDRVELTRFYRSLGTQCREIADSALAKLELQPPNGARLIAAGKPEPVDPAVLAKDGGVFSDCDRCPELTVVPGGTFLMGPREGEGNSYDGTVQKNVSVGRIAAGRHELTFEEHDACAVAGKCGKLFLYDYGDGRQQRPVNVRYHEALAYVSWLSVHTGHRYRLLTEAEWEHAARGGAVSRWYWGDDADQGCAYENLSDLALQETPGRLRLERGFVANCNDGLGDSTAPVGSYRPNPYGLYDMLGNRAEWVKSCEAGTSKDSPDKCHSHVARAGSFRTGPLLSAVTRRDAWGWKERAGTIRVARELD